MRNDAGQATHGCQLLGTDQGIFGQLSVSYVEATADISGKRTIQANQGNAIINNPAILAVGPAQTILD